MGLDYQHFWDHFYDSGYFNPSQRHRFRLILSEVSRILKVINKPAEAVRVLDMGCGLGHLIQRLKQEYPRLQCHGVDISEKAISELRGKMPGSSWDAADIQKPVELPLKGRYDIIICSEVLEHCEAPQEVLANIASLIAPGGWAIVTVPGGSRYQIDRDLGHLRHYQLPQVKALLSGYPFDLARAYAWGWPFLNLMRWTTDHFYAAAKKAFLDTAYNWRQKTFCQLLYLLMFVNIQGMGCQLVGVFRKSSSHGI